MVIHGWIAPLRDKAVFRSAAMEYSVPVWQDGKIDLAPEALYEVGITVKNREPA